MHNVNKVEYLDRARNPFTEIMETGGVFHDSYKKVLPDLSERKAFFRDNKLKLMKTQQIELNSWLEQVGRPELKLTLDEVIESIMG